MKKIINTIVLLACILGLGSCNDYLNVVPDNIPTINHAFNNRINAEKYLFTCYSYLPDPTSPNKSPGFLCGYESWITEEGTYYWRRYRRYGMRARPQAAGQHPCPLREDQ